MLKSLITFLFTTVLFSGSFETVIEKWQFRKGDDTRWEEVRVPHDWAISGPFDRSNDLQTVAVVQNGEKEASEKTGRSGGLPWMGKGEYRTSINVASLEDRRFELLFDGAMSEARVFVNNHEVGFWPYGYNSFHFDITTALHEGENDVRVELNNREQSSRWYPGAGLYRKVRLVEHPSVHVPIWGTNVITRHIGDEEAVVTVLTEVEGVDNSEPVTLETIILDAEGNEISRREDTRRIIKGQAVEQQFVIENPELWSPETPYLYEALTRVKTGARVDTEWGVALYRNRISVTSGDTLTDEVRTVFGIRTIEVIPEKGFFLNGKRTMFKGVCLHHDLGPLGAAVNKSALRHHLLMLKDMGCNAIRTSHNMPAEELIELCDELGFMVMVEPFDEWDEAKCENGYHRWWNDWAEKDMVNMIRHYRSHPSVVMWSIGNEVPTQWKPEGPATAKWLQDICHREDPSRPVTCGMDQFDGVLANGFAAELDVPGFNYKVDRYLQAYPLLPQGVILGSETASTVSSRGVYHFPLDKGYDRLHEDHQSSSYDVEYCGWSNIPDEDFAADEDYPWMLGQFVWTGFDYLGEPSPYDTDAWPNHSSVFGIIDLAGLPKDRFYLYRSVWNTESPTLHMLPHWTWPGREGEKTPVMVYTSYPQAELFVNGKSQGVRTFSKDNVLTRHRLIWEDVVYEPGELKVVAISTEGVKVDSAVVRTAGKPYALKCVANKPQLCSDGDDLAYVRVSVVDKDGTLVPSASSLVKISVKGAGEFKAVANGDPCCLESFVKPQMHLFNGELMFIVRASDTPGSIKASVSSKGLKSSTIIIENK